MILSEELLASVDDPSQCIIMHRTDPSRLRNLALKLGSSLVTLNDYNERLCDYKSNSFNGMGGIGSNNAAQMDMGKGSFFIV